VIDSFTAEQTGDPFRALLEAVADATVIVDHDSRIILVNSRAEQLFGLSREELLGERMQLLFPKRLQAMLEARLHAFTDPLAQYSDTVPELFGLRNDGAEFPVQLSLSRIQIESGLSTAVTIRDITLQRQTEHALLEKSAELERANRVKDIFLASMAHDLRSPLCTAISIAEFLAGGKPGPINAAQEQYLEHILNSGRQLLHLINDILDIVRIQAGELELSPGTFRLAEAVEEVCAGVAPIAQSKRINVAVEIDRELDTVTLDELRFKQSLNNLLSNALKFTGVGGQVAITANSCDSNFFRVAVRDSGIGIKSEDRQRIFTEFEQLETGPGRRYRGNGLGLALTRRIVEMQGGAIDVESELGAGSTFTLVLPLARQEATQ
jgi:PAS domain S-box-containing protein